MQVPILSGIYTDESSDFRTSYPRNLIPVPKNQGISKGYLRPADGLIKVADGPGVNRGGINWKGKCYRVLGTKLVRINPDNSYDILGDVGGTGTVSLDYSFDRLAIASSGSLYYWDEISLTQVTDGDLGHVQDVLWVDGYFMTTDGEFLVVTELNDPFSVLTTKYGSSEADPDDVVAIEKIRNEVHAVNRYSVEVFDNVGGTGFPFQRIDGGKMDRGAIGTHAVTTLVEALAFVGSGRNEAPSVWLGRNSQTVKIATREIDQILEGYTEKQLSEIVVESKVGKAHQHLYIHLPDRTLVYDAASSAETQTLVWFTVDSGSITPATYRARHFVWCYDKWLCADPTGTAYGYTHDKLSSHYGSHVGWEFLTIIIYNNGLGGIIHELELVTLPGRVALGEDPVVWTSFSVDGEVFGQERKARIGKQGERSKRIIWLSQGMFRHWRTQKFRGFSDCHASFARLEADIEALNV